MAVLVIYIFLYSLVCGDWDNSDTTEEDDHLKASLVLDGCPKNNAHNYHCAHIIDAVTIFAQGRFAKKPPKNRASPAFA